MVFFLHRMNDVPSMSAFVYPAAAVCCLVALCLPCKSMADDAAATENWPQWRGPLHTGANPAANPPTEWSEGQNVRWKVKLPGSGSSTPIIWGENIFIQTAMPAPAGEPAALAEPADGVVPLAQAPPPDGPRRRRRGEGRGNRGRGGFGRGQAPDQKHQFILLCLDRKTGETLWQKVAREEVPHEGHHRDHGFASGSPVTDGTHVWAFFGSRGLHCFDMEGNRKWEKDFGDMSTRNGFGEGSSPALFGDTLIINWDHEGDDFIVALDKTTGEERWRQPRDEITTWSTPLVVEHEGRAQVVVAATQRIRSYDLQTGKHIWECGGLTTNVIPTPVAGDGMVFVTSGFRGAAMMAIRLGHEGDLTGTDAIAWSRGRGTPYVPSPLLADGKLYLFSGNQGILSCFDATTGKAIIEGQRIDDLEGVYASPVAAGDRIYLTGRNGSTVVGKLDGDKLQILAANDLGERIDASPAAVGNELFLRGVEHLFCIAEK